MRLDCPSNQPQQTEGSPPSPSGETIVEEQSHKIEIQSQKISPTEVLPTDQHNEGSPPPLRGGCNQVDILGEEDDQGGDDQKRGGRDDQNSNDDQKSNDDQNDDKNENMCENMYEQYEQYDDNYENDDDGQNKKDDDQNKNDDDQNKNDDNDDDQEDQADCNIDRRKCTTHKVPALMTKTKKKVWTRIKKTGLFAFRTRSSVQWRCPLAPPSDDARVKSK